MSREIKKPKRSRIRTWCPGGFVIVQLKTKDAPRFMQLQGIKVIPRNKFVRCGVCDQRFEAQATPCCDGHCPPNHRVPKHKAY